MRSRRTAESLGETWPSGPVHADQDFAANTHIIRHGGRTLATVKAGALPYELTGELGTAGPCDFGGTLPGGFAAHTKLDPRTGELHAIAYFWGWDYVQHVVIGGDGLVSRTTGIPLPHKPIMHNFALAEKYVVLFDMQITFRMTAAADGLPLPYTWNSNVQARVGLLPRGGAAADVRWVEIEPCWVFHTFNAYDDTAARVVVDLIQYEGAYDVSLLSGRGPLTLDRWTIDLAAGKVAGPSARRQASGVPARGRAGRLPAAPLWLQRRHRGGQPGHDRAVRRLRRRGVRQRPAQARPSPGHNSSARVRARCHRR